VNHLFASLSDATPAQALHDRLVAEAERDDLLDVAYRTLDTPVGTLLLAATPVGLVRVAYDVEGHDAVLAALADRVSPRVLQAPARLDVTARELDEYFAGTRRAFDLEWDVRWLPAYNQRVLEALARVEYGQTTTYGTLAARTGNPRAARAVGTIMNRNPIPVVLPCHRVVGANGTLTGYAGGLERKERLLRLEGAIL
jgi:methylated-DNA-[protein]-cysteine S-methyltransferase